MSFLILLEPRRLPPSLFDTLPLPPLYSTYFQTEQYVYFIESIIFNRSLSGEGLCLPKWLYLKKMFFELKVKCYPYVKKMFPVEKSLWGRRRHIDLLVELYTVLHIKPHRVEQRVSYKTPPRRTRGCLLVEPFSIPTGNVSVTCLFTLIVRFGVGGSGDPPFCREVSRCMDDLQCYWVQILLLDSVSIFYMGNSCSRSILINIRCAGYSFTKSCTQLDSLCESWLEVGPVLLHQLTVKDSDRPWRLYLSCKKVCVEWGSGR